MTNITLGLSARNLRDLDTFSKSDPYLVISKPTSDGGFQQLKVSDTKQNTLNPDFEDFFFGITELCDDDETLNIRFQIFDDDGKKGQDAKDKLLGQGFWSLDMLRSAFNVQSELPLLEDGKEKKKKAVVVVRTFKIHD